MHILTTPSIIAVAPDGVLCDGSITMSTYIFYKPTHKHTWTIKQSPSSHQEIKCTQTAFTLQKDLFKSPHLMCNMLIFLTIFSNRNACPLILLNMLHVCGVRNRWGIFPDRNVSLKNPKRQTEWSTFGHYPQYETLTPPQIYKMWLELNASLGPGPEGNFQFPNINS